MTKKQNHTPMMQQWHSCKATCQNEILLFRMGDFYECFHDDAKQMSKALNVTLTARQGIPMAGVPVHSLDQTLEKLIKQKINIAIAEQVEDPKKSKGIVKREVVRHITPGTYWNMNDTTKPENRYVASLFFKDKYHATFLDVSTGECFTHSFENISMVFDFLTKSNVCEIITSSQTETFLSRHNVTINCPITTIDEWKFDINSCSKIILDHFNLKTTDSFGLYQNDPLICTSGTLIDHMKHTLLENVDHVKTIKKHCSEDIMQVDHYTLKHLAILEPTSREENDDLLSFLNQTSTSMGYRKLKHWLTFPSLNIETISKRQDGIQWFIDHNDILEMISSHTKGISDLLRLTNRLFNSSILPRDFISLRQSFEQLSHIIDKTKNIKNLTPYISNLLSFETTINQINNEISTYINPGTTNKVGDGSIFNTDADKTLSELYKFKATSHKWQADYESKIRDEYDIKNVKVSHTPAFGYYIEISKSQANKVGDDFKRRQTLVNSERFITDELKSFESKMYQIEHQIAEAEKKLYIQFLETTVIYADTIVSISELVASLDVICSMAYTAIEHEFQRPTFSESETFEIIQGRHPVIEQFVGRDRFIANDISFDNEQIMVLTGPNMSGKSTYIRQVALLALLAHTGSYVPVSKMKLSVIDRIFTRIGASDDLARGQSTFMVEMSETANILNNATDRSMIVLDEVGRGTSTYDGIAIARAIIEHIAEKIKAKTLFATHYFELTNLSETYTSIANKHISVDESQDSIIFTHRVEDGFIEKSYGVHVATIAGLPNSVIDRAKHELSILELNAKKTKQTQPVRQLNFFTQRKAEKCEIKSLIEEIDMNNITPIRAFETLLELTQKVKNETT